MAINILSILAISNDPEQGIFRGMLYGFMGASKA